MLRLGMFLLFTTGATLFADSDKAYDLSQYGYVRKTFLPDMVKCLPQETFSIVLDESFFTAPESSGSDICIIDEAGKVVPFELKKVPSTIENFRENQLVGKIVRNQQLPDGRNAIDFELDENNKAISLVELVGDKLPAGSQLSIAIGDGKNWQTAVDKLTLSDITQLTEPVNRRFPLLEQLKGKIVRLILEKGKFPALEAVRVFEQQRLESVQGTFNRMYMISHLGSKSEKTVLKTVYLANYTPLTRLEIVLDKELYLNKVTVLGSNDRRKWQEISSGTLRKVDMDSVNTLDFPECRYKYIMLNIEHAADAPVKVRDIQAYGPAYHYLLNGGEGRRALKIYYNPSTLEYSRAIMVNRGTFGSTGFSEYGINAPEKNKLHKTGVRDRNSWSYLAGAFIVICTFIAAIVLTSTVKRSNQLLPED